MKIRFSGLGGQGVVIAGVVYGHGGMFQGYHVLQSQSYGSTTRGGVTTSDVILAEQPIDELELPDCDVLVALCQEAYDRFKSFVRPGGLVLTEASLVDVDEGDPAGQRIALPAVSAARDQLGRQILANIVVLGGLAAVEQTVGDEALRQAIKAHVPPGTEQINMKAFDLGRSLSLSA
jgi:2-oxoglutarate ferredoxin oxidoreductase subunit gamma